MENATSFGKQAVVYAKGRPGYPDALYRWIAENSPAHDLVWDIGTGSGQAAIALTRYFKQVHATDISAEQITAAKPHPQISYHAAPAQNSGLPNGSAACISVATAVHWFSDTSFWEEVSRVAAKHALFCAWTYQLPICDTSIHKEFLDLVFALIDPYWAEGNQICMAGYSANNLNCPLPLLPAPKFDAGGMWSKIQLVNFVESWSAHFKAREDGFADELKIISKNFLKTHRDKTIEISLPISVLAARITK
jgi:SAM-dependent methyltransferase